MREPGRPCSAQAKWSAAVGAVRTADGLEETAPAEGENRARADASDEQGEGREQDVGVGGLGGGIQRGVQCSVALTTAAQLNVNAQ